MLAQVPEWLNDGAVVFGFIASVLAVLGGFIAITHYFTKRFKNEVGEVIVAKVPTMIDDKVQPIFDRLDAQDQVIADINRAVNCVEFGEWMLVQKVDSIEVRQRAHLMDLGIVDDEPEAGK